MSRFFGSTRCPIDVDGRLRLPVGPGEPRVGEPFVLTRDTEARLLLFPPDVWPEVLAAACVAEAPERARYRTRLLWASDVTVSPEWEITIPRVLVEVVGAGERTEARRPGHRLEEL